MLSEEIFVHLKFIEILILSCGDGDDAAGKPGSSLAEVAESTCRIIAATYLRFFEVPWSFAISEPACQCQGKGPEANGDLHAAVRCERGRTKQ